VKPLPFTQTRIWADLNQHHNAIEPLHVQTGVVQCLFGLHRDDKILTAFNGPVIGRNVSVESVQSFLEKTREEARNLKVFHIVFRSLPPLRSWSSDYENVLIKSGFQRQEWKTLILDLTATEGDLLKSFDHSARKGIKKAESLGVRVEKCRSFEDFYDTYLIPYFSLTNRPLRNKEFYQKGWEIGTEDVYSYWVAQTESREPLGFLGTYRYDGVATEIMSALTPLAFEKKIPVQDLLHWEIMKFHKEAGDQFFDLAGYNPNPISEKEKNIRKFKEKWGGNIYDTSTYSLDTRSFVQKIVSKIRNKINV
jgi:hypothetical protein